MFELIDDPKDKDNWPMLVFEGEDKEVPSHIFWDETGVKEKFTSAHVYKARGTKHQGKLLSDISDLPFLRWVQGLDDVFNTMVVTHRINELEN